MPITLAEAKVGMTNKVDQQVIDTFQRSSLLLDRLTFDNSISPGTGGSTLSYEYVQLLTPSTAAVRTINSEYTPGEAKRTEKTTKAIIMGGSFQLDRVIQSTSGAVDGAGLPGGTEDQGNQQLFPQPGNQRHLHGQRRGICNQHIRRIEKAALRHIHRDHQHGQPDLLRGAG